MGSGKRPSNVPLAPTPLGGSTVIHCPEEGRAVATPLRNTQPGQTGRLQLKDGRLLLIVDGVAVAEIIEDPRLRECVEVGSSYIATLEAGHAPPIIKYWSE